MSRLISKKHQSLIYVLIWMGTGLATWMIYQLSLESHKGIQRQDLSRVWDSLKDRTSLKGSEEEWSQLKQIALISGIRVTLIDIDGEALFDSHADSLRLEKLNHRPEVIIAIADGEGSDFRTSFTLGKQMLYLARTVEAHGEISHVVRLAVDADEITRKAWSMIWAPLAFGISFFLMAVVFIRHLEVKFKTINNHVVQVFDDLSRGNWQTRLPVVDDETFDDQRQMVNGSLGDIEDTVQAMHRQIDERKSVFGSMREGIIVFSREGVIIDINRAACDILELVEDQCIGARLEEYVRNSQIMDIEMRVRSGGKDVNEEVEFHNPESRVLSVSGTRIIDHEEQNIGHVLVFWDSTRVRQLEIMRKEFVANVSHELRTPLTAVKGFIETLLDNEDISKSDTKRFLTKASHNADRLHALIEDILTISRIEQQGLDLSDIQKISLKRLFNNIIVELEPLNRGEVKIEIECDDDVYVEGQPLFIHQVVLNLANNAIKYAKSGKVIRLDAENDGDKVRIRVVDFGKGIPSQHIPHLFERFYRVDKARSRESGGTGLGLSIVKHIVDEHGGTISVASQMGKGTTFTLNLPRHQKSGN